MGARALGAVAVAAALLVAAAASARGPEARTFVPGKSLGGVRVGMTQAAVRALWGNKHGVCRSCTRTTWYFNYRPFEPEGTGVVFERGRVVHVFTLWQPEGWRTPGGLVLGANEAEVTERYRTLVRRRCAGYDALVRTEHRTHTLFYVFEGELWAFGLARRGADPCV